MTTRCPEASLTHFAGVNNWPESNLTIRKNNETFFFRTKKKPNQKHKQGPSVVDDVDVGDVVYVVDDAGVIILDDI